MARTPQDVTDAELAVLQFLWSQGSATRRQITDSLYPEGNAAQYATVQKLLERLEAKGYVSHKRAVGSLTFQATIDRDDLIGRRLLEVADKLCGGSLTPLLMNLVRARPMTDGELSELRAFVKEMSGKPRRKGDRH
jgi:predicted transcriptional regulator